MENFLSNLDTPIANRAYPLVTVIIPMYNAEKYIEECLNSLLAQTFQDFEVIVVDDCSTDNSVAIVQSYESKFGSRLKIYGTEKNSGGGGYVPRNIGLEFSQGKYIFFIDADDFIVKTALEILYTAAKQSEADVIYTSNFYAYLNNADFNLRLDIESARIREKGLEDKPTLTIDSPNKNLQQLLLAEGILHMPWTKFVERKFLLQNKITFPEIISSGDFIWTIEVMYYTKRFLRLPLALYFYRDNAFDSVTRKKRTLNEQISACVSAFLLGAKALQDLSDKIDLLKQNPSYLGAALKPLLMNCLGRTFNERMQLSYSEIYEILYRKFVKESNSSDLLMPFFFSVIDAQQKELLAAQRRISELEKKLGSD